MKMSDEALKIIEESQNREKLKQVIDLIEERLVEHAIVPTELQWTILINHLNEMLKRSQKKGNDSRSRSGFVQRSIQRSHNYF